MDAAACQICFPHLCRMDGLLFCKSPFFFPPIPICGSDLFHGRVVSTSSSQSRGAIFQVWISTVWSLHAYVFLFFFWPLVSLAFLILFLVRRGTPIGVHQEATGLFSELVISLSLLIEYKVSSVSSNFDLFFVMSQYRLGK